jgi:hypothetical protein
MKFNGVEEGIFMDKKSYLESGPVKDFAFWIEGKLDKPNSFVHAYKMKKPKKDWECDSIYAAYENYCWPFRYEDPDSGNDVRGSSLKENLESLSRLSQGLREGIQDNDNEACKMYCLAILKWGGVRNNNDKWMTGLGNDLCRYLISVKSRLGADLAVNQYYSDSFRMNSGFTKIYALYIDEFIMYDGRVGAALGLMVRIFCEENDLRDIPKELAFAWERGRTTTYEPSSLNRRNPSNERYVFPKLNNNPRRHFENNIRANWLLWDVLSKTKSQFGRLDRDVQMLALESALFMIGYDVRGKRTS